MINTVYILLGSNLENKEQNLINAIKLLQKNVGEIIKSSTFYYSEPWGFKSDNEFVNQAIKIKTQLNPKDLLKQTKLIENKLGRKNKSNNSIYFDRIIDIDILFYNDLILETLDLTIPHPLLHKRLFTLNPLNEIAVDFIHPVFKESISKLLDNLKATKKDC